MKKKEINTNDLRAIVESKIYSGSFHAANKGGCTFIKHITEGAANKSRFDDFLYPNIARRWEKVKGKRKSTNLF